MKATSAVIAVLSVALAGALAGNYLQYQRYSSSRPIMRIGGDAVTRKMYQDKLEYAYGKPILNELVFQKIILDAAKKQGVLPTEADVDGRIKDIQRRNSAALAQAERDPDKMKQLRENLMSNIALENLRIKDVKSTPEDVASFYAQNKAAFRIPTQVKTTIVAAQNADDAALVKNLFSQNIAPDVIARQPRLGVVGVNGFALPPNLPQAFARNLSSTVLKMQAGQVATFPIGKSVILVRANSVSPESVVPFAQAEPIATRMYKLSKAPSASEELTRLYKDGNVVFEIDRYNGYFTDIEGAVKRMDAVTTK